MSSSEVTELLIQWCNGDESALERLIPLVQKELHRRAHNYMRREAPGHILQTADLVQEAYLRLMNQKRVHWQNRAHFFAIAAHIMRRILLNYARDQKRKKRGGNAIRISISDVDIMSDEKSVELILLDEALTRLALIDERKSRIVELRYFGGLTVEETAEVLKISPQTVRRDWDLAKAWLVREITNEA